MKNYTLNTLAWLDSPYDTFDPFDTHNFHDDNFKLLSMEIKRKLNRNKKLPFLKNSFDQFFIIEITHKPLYRLFW